MKYLLSIISLVIFILNTGFLPEYPPTSPISIVTDHTWEVSGKQTLFGEFPLPAEMIPSATSPLYGGNFSAVTGSIYEPSKVIPGTTPIWRNQNAEGGWEAYQFRKTVSLGSDKIQKITLSVNCDDAARVYINKRLVNTDQRGAKLKNSRGTESYFHTLTAFSLYDVYTFDVTDFFFTNYTNSIVVEVANQPYNDNHAYLSAKIVIEFAPNPEPVYPDPPKKQASAKPKAPVVAETQLPSAKKSVAKPAALEKAVFEAGSDPEMDKLKVGTILELGHVFFKANDYHLDSESYYTLSALADFIKRHPNLKIEIGGHTNLRVNDRFAAELSTNRAKTVMQYLIDSGVPENRLTHKGYGKSHPRIHAVSKEADPLNQRVEIKILQQ